MKGPWGWARVPGGTHVADGVEDDLLGRVHCPPVPLLPRGAPHTGGGSCLGKDPGRPNGPVKNVAFRKRTEF